MFLFPVEPKPQQPSINGLETERYGMVTFRGEKPVRACWVRRNGEMIWEINTRNKSETRYDQPVDVRKL